MSQDIYVCIEHVQGQVADISYVMLRAARELASQTGGGVVAALLGHEASQLAEGLGADRVLYIDHPALKDFSPDAYQQVLAGIIKEDSPRAVLLGNTTIGSDVAGALSAGLGVPLVSSCRSVGAGGKLVIQTCGGKIMAEVDLPATTTLLTVIPGGYLPEEGKGAKAPEVIARQASALEGPRVRLRKYIEPETGDVDISKEALLVAVGRGIQQQDNLELAEELASVLGGAVCASRPVVDQGWLPVSRLVGKSGKRVKAKVYLALGISGAPEHVEAVTDAEMIIAVNTDAAAPIFSVAKYGATVDLFDLVPVLTERIREAKSS
jgi:electron transfer flavoprotein alpha subunit